MLNHVLYGLVLTATIGFSVFALCGALALALQLSDDRRTRPIWWLAVAVSLLAAGAFGGLTEALSAKLDADKCEDTTP